jgi:hypothetical protein
MNAVAPHFRLPPDKAATLDKAVRREWVFIGFLISIVIVMALVMGSSQTMKAMWMEDTLSLIPSFAFLVGAHYRKKEPMRLGLTAIGARCQLDFCAALLRCSASACFCLATPL